MQKPAIFPMFYLAPISYYIQLKKHAGGILIEDSEHFQKQTYRSRASIYSANGKLDLIIPVIKGSGQHSKIREVRISNEFRWQRLHWMSLQTCYRSSPYFEFYEDGFRPFYEKQFDFLFDFNEALLHTIADILKIKVNFEYSREFIKEYPGEDFRNSIHPKKGSEHTLTPYFQVFQDRHGYLANLSIVDLLFNCGPESATYLR